MAMRYSVTQVPVATLFAWAGSGEIAIPEIQRPFVWDAVKVRNLLDSLFRGYPVGYLIAWRNPDVKLKDGTTAAGKRILIDGQQRVTALLAALLGREVVNKSYQKVRIRIAFHPVEQRFEVANPAIEKDVAWLPDIATVFDERTSLFELVNRYCTRNSSSNTDEIFRSIELLRGITSNQIGLIELDPGLDIETVTEIFSSDIGVRELIEVKSDVHHIFPRDYLKRHGMVPGQYNQIANYAVTQSEINIAIGSKEPRVYFRELLDQCQGGPKRYGNITDLSVLQENLRVHCIPDGIEVMTVADYSDFLVERRKLMAQKIRCYFEAL